MVLTRLGIAKANEKAVQDTSPATSPSNEISAETKAELLKLSEDPSAAIADKKELPYLSFDMPRPPPHKHLLCFL